MKTLNALVLMVSLNLDFYDGRRKYKGIFVVMQGVNNQCDLESSKAWATKTMSTTRCEQQGNKQELLVNKAREQ